jgi:hypothetical protein
VTNSRNTEDALRLLAERDVRIVAIVACVSVVLAFVSTMITFFIPPSTTGFNWYMTGLTTGFTLSTWGALLVTVRNTRMRHAMEKLERDATSIMMTKIVAELDRRGDNYEAVLSPAGIVIQRKGARDPFRFH